MERLIERPLERIDYRTLMACVQRNPKGKLREDLAAELQRELHYRELEGRSFVVYKP